MLARTADNLFWLSRYMERADYLARIVNVANRLQSMPAAYGGERNEWESALISAGAIEAFNEAYDKLEPRNAIEFLVYDTQNPSSIVNCIEYARTNARAVRTALTVETWETINSGWLDVKRAQTSRGDKGDVGSAQLSSLLELISKISLDVDGSAYRTMLRNDAYWFSRLGLFVERADNTARLLDVKYNILLPEMESVGGSLDYFQWTAILRAVSALTSYHWVYRQSIKPWLIADLLILRPEMPRSLIACYGEIARFLDAIGRAYGRQGASQRHARHVLTRLEHASIKDVFSSGLHEFITEFIEDNRRLGVSIAEQYLVS
jgi:uncharacterized alpha-E superfamily protein